MPYTDQEQIAAYGITDTAMRAHFNVSVVQQGPTANDYTVRRVNSTNCAWPSDEALMQYCDERNLLGPVNHFGGTVEENGNVMAVRVYHD